jgi:hypothetical protein
MQRPSFRLSTAFFLLALVLTACSGGESGPVQAIESYLQALTDQDPDQLVNVSCADWEASALTEVDSLTAVTTQLEDLACQEAGQQDADTLVTCTGKIIFDYNGEIQELDLAGRTYITREEGGEWRMCGYR